MRRRFYADVPPREIEDFTLWCISRGEFDTERQVYTGDRAVWAEARRRWAEAHGWPAGFDWADVGPAAEEPWDPDSI